MERKQLTERGRELYKIRGQSVEPVFGQIKDVRGFDRFMQRGIEACRGEWSRICATHNLLKLWRSGTRPVGIEKKAVFTHFDVKFCLIYWLKHGTKKVKKRRLGYRELTVCPG